MPTDTYVCVTCAGALDTNPGTQASPFRTIARGIAVAQQLGGTRTVHVGGAQGTTTSYAEDITIPANVTVLGRYVVSNTFTWTRSASNPRTLLINLSVAGVTFAPGVTRSAGLDGLRVQSSGALAGATTVSAISIVDASPTLRDFEVDPPANGLPVPATAVGVSITGTGSVRPNPLLAGVSGGTSTVFADIQAGPATTTSLGISVNNASVEVDTVDTRGGPVSGASSSSAGAFLVNGAGSSFRNGDLWSGFATGGTCAGLVSTGDSSGLRIEQLDLRGCMSLPAFGATPPIASVGVSVSNCPAVGPGSSNPRLVSSSVQGGIAQGPNSYVAGVVASDGCALQVESNPSLVGSIAVNVVPQSSAGVLCTHEGGQGVTGRNSACRIANNPTINGGRAVATSIGLACIGNCAAGNLACLGSCSEVYNNGTPSGTAAARGVIGENARFVAHGLVTQSSPRIARNTFGSDAAQCTTSGGGSTPFLYGLRLEGSASRVENNLVMGGVCPNIIAFEQANVRRTGDMSAPAPNVHSNTFVPVAGSSSIGFNQLIVGAVVRSMTPLAVFPPLGEYRNNIFTAFGFATVRFAFQEADASSDPVAIEHNDFWAPPGSSQPLYQDEGTTTFTSAGQINGLNGILVSSFNNLSNDPGFIGSFRIGATSAMRFAGGMTGAPTEDIDGQRRPMPLNTAPDIGCDETQ